jgi:hypothetical protein
MDIKEYFLYQILSLGSVSQDSTPNSIYMGCVTLKQLTEGVAVFLVNQAQQELIGKSLLGWPGLNDAALRNSAFGLACRERKEPGAGRSGIHSHYLLARVSYPRRS